MLDSDALGQLGESKFTGLCASANLTCNDSKKWDRAGWDFILDFELDESGRTSLDHRKSPLSCRVQQKTVWHTSRSVQLSLKMAERLAKDPGPTFICVFKVGEDHEVSEAYLIPMMGGRLATVLKRLRKEGPKASSDSLKDKTISFTPLFKEKMVCSGVSLLSKLKEHVGEDIHAYVENGAAP